MSSDRDVVIVEGVRTPFVKSDTKFREIHPAEHFADRRHNQVIDCGGDNFAKSRANDNAHSKINHIAFYRKLLKFLKNLFQFLVSFLYKLLH